MSPELEKAIATVLYLKDKKIFTIQEAHEIEGAMLTIHANSIEQLQKQNKSLEERIVVLEAMAKKYVY